MNTQSVEKVEKPSRLRELLKVQSPAERLIPVKKIVEKFNVSEWSIYEAIRTDPTFPVVAAGPKKSYRINPRQFEMWLRERSRRKQFKQVFIPTADDLLRQVTK